MAPSDQFRSREVGAVAREVCMAGESDVIAGPDGAKRISELLRDYFAPEALDSVYQEVVRFSQFGRAAQTTDGFLVRLDLPRKKAASKKQGAGGLSGSIRVGAAHA